MTRILNSIIFVCLIPVLIFSQDSNGEKEVIIIEKTYDAEGNVISKNTKRFQGNYSEDQIQQFIDEDSGPSVKSYDLEGLGFGDNLKDLFKIKDQRPTIGLNLNFENDRATVEKITSGSGAEKADIRTGDVVISINGLPISNIEDIYGILDKKKKGDQIRLIVFRDGEELEKNVELGVNEGNSLFFELPDGGSFRLFGEENSEFPLEIDSLFKSLRNKSDMFNDFGFGEFGLDEKSNESEHKTSDRPSLGVFIEDTNAEILITDVIDGSPADRAGIRKDDVILRIDDDVVTSYREVGALLNKHDIGDTIVIEIDRKGKIIELNVRLQ